MFRFDDNTFDPDTGEVAGPRESVRLQPKPAHLLTMLLEADGDLVEREEIRVAVWPDTNVDFDASLNTCVRQIRTALRESGGEAEYIETLPKRGYRFTVPVVSDRSEPGRQGPIAVPRSTHPGPSTTRPYLLVFALLAMGTAAVMGWQLGGAPGNAGEGGTEQSGIADQAGAAPGEAAPAPARLAVVPFVDPVSDANAAFNRDLTEAFVAALVNAMPDDIVVIGPSTTAQYFTDGSSLPDVAAAVNADFVLHGGHRSSADTFFVEVVLPDGEHLFAQRMNLDLSKAVAVPLEVVVAMTASIIKARGR